MKITRTNPSTGERHVMVIDVDPAKFLSWEMNRTGSRPHIQVAFPELSDDEREFILTGKVPFMFQGA